MGHPETKNDEELGSSLEEIRNAPEVNIALVNLFGSVRFLLEPDFLHLHMQLEGFEVNQLDIVPSHLEDHESTGFEFYDELCTKFVDGLSDYLSRIHSIAAAEAEDLKIDASIDAVRSTVKFSHKLVLALTRLSHFKSPFIGSQFKKVAENITLMRAVFERTATEIKMLQERLGSPVLTPTKPKEHLINKMAEAAHKLHQISGVLSNRVKSYEGFFA